MCTYIHPHVAYTCDGAIASPWVEVLNTILRSRALPVAVRAYGRAIKNVGKCGRIFIALCLPRNAGAHTLGRAVHGSRAIAFLHMAPAAVWRKYRPSVNAKIFNSPRVPRTNIRRPSVFNATGETPRPSSRRITLNPPARSIFFVNNNVGKYRRFLCRMRAIRRAGMNLGNARGASSFSC